MSVVPTTQDGVVTAGQPAGVLTELSETHVGMVGHV